VLNIKLLPNKKTSCCLLRKTEAGKNKTNTHTPQEKLKLGHMFKPLVIGDVE
jgi:hypothetical protein